MNKRLEKLHKRKVARAKDKIRLSEPIYGLRSRSLPHEKSAGLFPRSATIPTRCIRLRLPDPLPKKSSPVSTAPTFSIQVAVSFGSFPDCLRGAGSSSGRSVRRDTLHERLPLLAGGAGFP